MDYIGFITRNWYLFAALVVIVALLLVEPVRRRTSGVRELGPLEVPRLVSHDSAVVVDVSDNNDYRKGHIQGAINAPFAQLDDNLRKLEKHREKPVVVVCQNGMQSRRAASRLRGHGFSNVHVLAGGIAAWRKENLPLVGK